MGGKQPGEVRESSEGKGRERERFIQPVTESQEEEGTHTGFYAHKCGNVLRGRSGVQRG